MEKHTANIAIFASGSGSNAENIINFSNTSGTYCVKAVFCNNKTAYVLERAKRLGVPSYIFSAQEFKNGTITIGGIECGFAGLLDTLDIDYIILAGFLLKVPDSLVSLYPGRILNIHPALLPAYGGKGMYGEYVHKAVIAAGENRSGITIHIVDNHYDHGETIYQDSCEITPEDTPESLAAKIHELEKAYPKVIDDYIRAREK